VPASVLRWASQILGDVVDETGIELRGSYALAYEGWGSICVAEAWDRVNTVDANEDAAYLYAAKLSETVIQQWAEEFKLRYDLVHAGYEPTGLYGVTWALLRLRDSRNKKKQLADLR